MILLRRLVASLSLLWISQCLLCKDDCSPSSLFPVTGSHRKQRKMLIFSQPSINWPLDISVGNSVRGHALLGRKTDRRMNGRCFTSSNQSVASAVHLHPSPTKYPNTGSWIIYVWTKGPAYSQLESSQDWLSLYGGKRIAWWGPTWTLFLLTQQRLALKFSVESPFFIQWLSFQGENSSPYHWPLMILHFSSCFDHLFHCG